VWIGDTEVAREWCDEPRSVAEEQGQQGRADECGEPTIGLLEHEQPISAVRAVVHVLVEESGLARRNGPAHQRGDPLPVRRACRVGR
jgi:hypothetical protein